MIRQDKDTLPRYFKKASNETLLTEEMSTKNVGSLTNTIQGSVYIPISFNNTICLQYKT